MGCIGSDSSNPMEAVPLSPERHGVGLGSERPSNLEVLHSAGGFEEDVGAKDEATGRGSAASPVFEGRTIRLAENHRRSDAHAVGNAGPDIHVSISDALH